MAMVYDSANDLAGANLTSEEQELKIREIDLRNEIDNIYADIEYVNSLLPILEKAINSVKSAKKSFDSGGYIIEDPDFSFKQRQFAEKDGITSKNIFASKEFQHTINSLNSAINSSRAFIDECYTAIAERETELNNLWN